MKKFLFAGMMAVTALGVQSCLDFDDPGAELGAGQTTVDATVYHGNVDSIDYLRDIPVTELKHAIDTLNKMKMLGNSLTGQYCLRGAKNGDVPGAHAYQRQFSLGPDAYAQYMVVHHKDFMYGTLTSAYNVSEEFNGDPLGSYTMVKNALMPLLNHPIIDTIPEFKAINLLYYCVSAQERADLSGPYTYLEDKLNSEEPVEYNDLKTIYYGVKENLDTIVACLKHYEANRSKEYKKEIQKVMTRYCTTSRAMFTGDWSMDSYIRLANSLKLRMAMHMVKIEPETAKQWAEEAVASGVIETVDQQHALYPMVSGFTHPYVEICNSWSDLRLCASFESLLMSLKHPYTKYVFANNSQPIINEATGEELPAHSKIVGLRAGRLMPDGQNYPLNPLAAFSSINSSAFAMAPLYLVKLAEVNFLRAEGALRGWNMGGTAEYFYEEGIKNAYLDEPMMGAMEYNAALADYMALETPVDYKQVEVSGDGEDWPSVTKIGVKWNDGDDQETKLEKIITQKYIALFPLSTEAWTEMRRTGYPKVFPVLNADDGDGSIEQGEMIRRIPWNASDPIVQQLIEASGLATLGGPDLQATRLWWDVDAPNF
ncbi:MAG: SusD/RagB family nutrient-binding outer membrane lipoprotein [Bacteroidaceae bacterium]|nr:SusD/RagB family nutrient-binding outer membrane lipoprotein [Bacteroidaceae bacterium]